MFDFPVRAQLNRIEAKLDLVLRRLGVIIHEGTNEMTTLADIKTALDAQSDKLTALASRIEAQANSGAPDPAALQAIADELKSHNDQIDALDVASVPDQSGAGTTT